MTVAELISKLSEFPPHVEVGAFEAFDCEGPCSYTVPQLWLNPETGKVQIDPEGV